MKLAQGAGRTRDPQVAARLARTAPDAGPILSDALPFSHVSDKKENKFVFSRQRVKSRIRGWLEMMKQGGTCPRLLTVIDGFDPRKTGGRL